MGWLQVLLMVLLAIVALFMILLILIQRGRGGGLVGALGGMGGQSAFGTKAGDLFTRITMWTAFVWIVLAAFTVKILSQPPEISGEFGKNQPTAVEGAAPQGESTTGGGVGGLETPAQPGTPANE